MRIGCGDYRSSPAPHAPRSHPLEATRYFADPEVCHAYLKAKRWPEGVACPHCGNKALGYVSTVRLWRCAPCKKRFSIKSGTIFESSSLGLDKWLPCVWMIVNAKNGVASCEIARSLGVTQKTGWFMLHRVREALYRRGMGEQQLPEEIRRMFQQAQGQPKLADGWHNVFCRLEHRGQVKTKIMPLQIMGATKRIVIEWMVGFDKTDWQVKQSILIDLKLLRPAPPILGAGLMYDAVILVPDEIDLESPDNTDGTA